MISHDAFRTAVVTGAIGALAAGAHGQLAIYSNGAGAPEDPGLATGLFTEDHTLARPGCRWSEVPADGLGNANSIAGFSAHGIGSDGGYRFADDFTVTDPTGWRLLTITFFAYQVGASAGTTPVSELNFRIWNAHPGQPGAVIVFGDTASNRLVATQKTNIYRVFSSTAAPQPQPPDMARQIWSCDADAGGVVLAPGTYWLDWQFTGTDADTPVFCPPVTLYGARGKADANAAQFRASLGGWVTLVDAGKPASALDIAQDLPFILRGGVVPPACIADFNGDGFVDGIDYDQFVAAFEQGLQSGDVNGDGYVDGIDYDQFLAIFEQGC